MKIKFSVFLVVVFLTLTLNGFAQKGGTTDDRCVDQSGRAYCITFDPVGYSGVYFVTNDKGVTVKYDRKKTVLLAIGQRIVQIGTNGYNQEISFTVKPNGTVDGISNSTALRASGKTIYFNNVSVEIDPQQYEDIYFPSIFYRQENNGQRQGKLSFTFVPNLEYLVELYNAGYNDEIKFKVEASGVIGNISNPEAAFARGRSLVFNNVSAVINPDAFTRNFYIAAKPRTNQQEITLVPNTKLLVYIADNKGQTVTVKKTHIEPASLNLPDENNAPHTFRFAVRPKDLRAIGWWQAEDNPNDSIGNNNGTIIPAVSYSGGMTGKAFNFDGVNGNVKINNPFSLNGGAVDFGFYWNGNPTNDYRVLMGSCVRNVNPSPSGCDNRAPLFRIRQNNLTWEFSDKFNNRNLQIQPDKWYHITFTYIKYSDKYAVAFYVGEDCQNGRLIEANYDINSVDAFYTDYAFGKGTLYVTAGGFNGRIDEVKIFTLLNARTTEKNQ